MDRAWAFAAVLGLAVLTALICLPAAAQTPAPAEAASTDPVEVTAPELVLRGVPFEVSVKTADAASGPWALTVNGVRFDGTAEADKVTFKNVVTDQPTAVLLISDPSGRERARLARTTAPGWISLLPALLAITSVLLFRQVVLALTFGVWIGASLAHGVSPIAFVTGLFDVVPTYVITALSDDSRVSILVFTILIGALIGVLTRNGGMNAIASALARLARSDRRAQGATNILGLGIFFDDYANALVVGNTMRPITDRLRVSREKLAYIVDSTAAPVSSIAIITTWIGFMVSTIDSGIKSLDGFTDSAYSVFLDSLTYSFYPILAIILVWLVVGFGRDFGPMLAAEQKARREGVTPPPDFAGDDLDTENRAATAETGRPASLWTALIPLMVLIFGTLAGVIYTGMADSPEGASVRDIFGAGDSFKAMMWASFFGCGVAIALTLATRRLSLDQTMEAWLAGARSMMLPAIVLTLAWSLSDVNGVVQTDDYLVNLLGDSLPAAWMPVLVFVLSAGMAFTTGTSWGVMGIVMPLVLPLSWAVLGGGADGLTGTDAAIFSASIAAVLGGAVWGDHCSPISDTTVMSSIASGCNHADHVRTQLPYATLAAAVAVGIGMIPVGYGVPWWVALLLSIVVLTVFFRMISTPVERYSDPTG